MNVKPFATMLAAIACLPFGVVAVAADETVAEAIANANAKPSVVITGDGTVARPTADSHFGISILSTKDGLVTKLPIVAVEGLAHVDLAPGQEFRVLLVNNSPVDVAASVSIDGVNMFAFSADPARKADGKLRIGKSGGIVDGWYYGEGKSRVFQAGRIDESDQPVDRRKEGVGGVTVAFFTDRPLDSVPEKTVPLGTTASGKVVEQNSFQNLTAAVTVRYQKPE